MKYLCLVYFDEENLQALSPSDHDALTGEALAYDDVLRQSGHYVASNALQSVECATTIRARQGKISTTDGPFAETKEHLGGYYLVDAKDLDEALGIAARIPSARFGAVEVRPIMKIEH